MEILKQKRKNVFSTSVFRTQKEKEKEKRLTSRSDHTLHQKQTEEFADKIGSYSFIQNRENAFRIVRDRLAKSLSIPKHLNRNRSLKNNEKRAQFPPSPSKSSKNKNESLSKKNLFLSSLGAQRKIDMLSLRLTKTYEPQDVKSEVKMIGLGSKMGQYQLKNSFVKKKNIKNKQDLQPSSNMRAFNKDERDKVYELKTKNRLNLTPGILSVEFQKLKNFDKNLVKKKLTETSKMCKKASFYSSPLFKHDMSSQYLDLNSSVADKLGDKKYKINSFSNRRLKRVVVRTTSPKKLKRSFFQGSPSSIRNDHRKFKVPSSFKILHFQKMCNNSITSIKKG